MSDDFLKGKEMHIQPLLNEDKENNYNNNSNTIIPTPQSLNQNEQNNEDYKNSQNYNSYNMNSNSTNTLDNKNYNYNGGNNIGENNININTRQKRPLIIYKFALICAYILIVSVLIDCLFIILFKVKCGSFNGCNLADDIFIILYLTIFFFIVLTKKYYGWAEVYLSLFLLYLFIGILLRILGAIIYEKRK